MAKILPPKVKWHFVLDKQNFKKLALIYKEKIL